MYLCASGLVNDWDWLFCLTAYQKLVMPEYNFLFLGSSPLSMCVGLGFNVLTDQRVLGIYSVCVYLCVYG